MVKYLDDVSFVLEIFIIMIIVEELSPTIILGQILYYMPCNILNLIRKSRNTSKKLREQNIYCQYGSIDMM